MVETFLGSSVRGSTVGSHQNFGEKIHNNHRNSSDKIPSNIKINRNVSNIFGAPSSPQSLVLDHNDDNDDSFDTNVSRFKRASNDYYDNDEDQSRYENTQKEESPIINTHAVEINNDNQNSNDKQAKRKVLKVIKRKPKLLSRDIMLDNTEESSINVRAISSTQEYLDQVKSTLVINPTRKRIAITRKKTKQSEDISSSPSLPEVKIAPTKRFKKVLKTKKRLLHETPVEPELDYDEETHVPSVSPSHPEPPQPIIYTTSTHILDTITTTTTRQRTYTYVVTRVNDKESVVMSSTSVKDHVGPATQTVTRTISLTITIPPIQQLQTRLPEFV